MKRLRGIPYTNAGIFKVRRKFGWWWIHFYTKDNKYIESSGPFQWAEVSSDTAKECARALRAGFKSEFREGLGETRQV